jgi:hypothetical protein
VSTGQLRRRRSSVTSWNLRTSETNPQPKGRKDGSLRPTQCPRHSGQAGGGSCRRGEAEGKERPGEDVTAARESAQAQGDALRQKAEATKDKASAEWASVQRSWNDHLSAIRRISRRRRPRMTWLRQGDQPTGLRRTRIGPSTTRMPRSKRRSQQCSTPSTPGWRRTISPPN